MHQWGLRRTWSVVLLITMLAGLLPQAALAITLPGATPVANPDAYTASSDAPIAPLVATAPGVLANDGGGVLAAALVSAPSHATAFTLHADGSFTYTPMANYAGPDSFTYTASNGHATSVAATVTIAVGHGRAAPAITSANATTFTIGVPGAFTVTTTGFPLPMIAETGPLPGGVSLTDNHDGTATLAGTPGMTSGGVFAITITAHNGSGADATQAFTLTVNGNVAFTSAAQTTFTVGQAPSTAFTITTSGIPAVTTITESGPLPTGVSFVDNHDGTAKLTGAPNAGTGGAYLLMLTAHNGAGPDATQAFTLTVDEAPTITSANHVTFVVGTAGTFAVVATGFPAPTFSEIGALPANVTLAANGTLAGTPAVGTGGVYPITITAHNAAAPDAIQTFTLTVDAAPTVASTTPANGATNVPLNSTVTVTFDKQVNVTASAFTLECPSGTPVAFTVTPASPATSFVLHPTANLPGGVICTATAVAAQITDVDAGQAMAANAQTSFTIDAPPTVTTIVPANGATNVPLTSTVTITFSEPVNVTGTAFKLECPSGTPVAFGVSPASPTTSFVLTPSANLPGGAVCTTTVVASQVTDVDFGQNMAANFTASFTVDTPPTVTTTTPANGATGVATTATVTVNFSKSVNVTGTAFTLECPAGTPVAFTVTPASPATSFVLTPSANLPAGVVCTATVVAAQVTDTVGTAMAANYTFTFNVPPIATNDTYPHNVIGNVSVNSSLIPYSVTSNDLSVTPFTITAFDATSAHGGTVTMTTSGAGIGQLTYNPAAGYTGGDSFTYTITSAGGSATGTVSFTVSGIIWFIDNNAAAGDGRLSSPFNSLAAFQAINDGVGTHPAANANIFLYESATNYTGPVTLLNGQKLIGQDATATLAAITGLTPGASSAPLPTTNSGNGTIVRITSSGNTVTLGSGNTVQGLTLGNATGIALTGASVGSLKLRDLTITTTGAAVSLASGALDAILTAVTSGGGTHGLALANTTGSFEVTGDGASDPANTTHGRTTAKNGGGTLTLGSGGTIGGATSAGVLLNNASNVTLRNMTIQNNGSGINTGGDGITASGGTSGLTLDNAKITGHSGNYGLHGTTVSNVALQHTEISANATTAGVETPHVWNVRFDDLTGASSSIQNSLFFDSRENIMGLEEGSISGTATATLTVANSEFRDTATTAPGNDGLAVNLHNSANVTLSVSSSTFLRNRSGAIQYTGNNSSGGGTISVTNSTFDQNAIDVNIAHQGLGKTVDFTIQGNTMRQNVGGQGNSINIFLAGLSNATSVLQGKVLGNTIGNNAVTDSGSSQGQGINLFASGAGTLTATVDGNTVRQIHQDSAFQAISSNHTGQLNLTVSNNDFRVSTTSGLGLFGIDLTVGGSGGAGDTGTFCANLTNNNIAAIADPTLWGINAQALAAGATLNLQGYGGAANDKPAINTFLNTRATTVTPPAQSFISLGATIKAAPSPCPTPP